MTSQGHFSDRENISRFGKHFPYGKVARTGEQADQRYEFIEQCLVQYIVVLVTRCFKIGDFNSRTGVLSDGIDDSSFGVSNDTDIPDRCNCDQTVNSYGEKLIELCQSTEHVILNGRFRGDSLGYFTYMSKVGSSVVDYFLANTNLYNLVSYFRVSPLSHLSDHCLLDACLEFRGTASCNTTNGDNMRPLYDRLQSDHESKDNYIMSLLSEESQEKMVDFLTKTYSTSPTDVNQAVVDFSTILVNAGLSSFRLKKGRTPRGKKRKKSKPWFDDQCSSLRREVRTAKRRMLAKPLCNQARLYYIEVCRKYKKLLKRKQADMKDKMVNQLRE